MAHPTADLNNKGEMANFYVTDCKMINNTGYAGIIKVSEGLTCTNSIYKPN